MTDEQMALVERSAKRLMSQDGEYSDLQAVVPAALRLLAEARAFRKLLASIEWVDAIEYDTEREVTPFCPVCHRYQYQGHDTLHCKLHMLLQIQEDTNGN